MQLARLVVGPLQVNCYIVYDEKTKEAIVIDPNRDIAPYLAVAAREGLRITHVAETHIHADFASGARELAHATGALLLLSDEGDAAWKYAFAAEGRLLHHGDRITIGNIHVDAAYMTSVPGIFAAGDSHSGASLVVRAINHGRRASAAASTRTPMDDSSRARLRVPSQTMMSPLRPGRLLPSKNTWE